MKITGVYVNAEKGTLATREIEAELQSYYDLLDVSTIDIVSRKIRGVSYEIICDDEALCKDKPVVSMISSRYQPMLFGNLFVVNYGGNGGLASLTPADVKRIKQSYACAIDSGKMRKVLVGDYA